MPLSDSSQTYMRAVWPKPSPAVLRLTRAAGVCEVSRHSLSRHEADRLGGFLVADHTSKAGLRKSGGDLPTDN